MLQKDRTSICAWMPEKPKNHSGFTMVPRTKPRPMYFKCQNTGFWLLRRRNQCTRHGLSHFRSKNCLLWSKWRVDNNTPGAIMHPDCTIGLDQIFNQCGLVLCSLVSYCLLSPLLLCVNFHLLTPRPHKPARVHNAPGSTTTLQWCVWSKRITLLQIHQAKMR